MSNPLEFIEPFGISTTVVDGVAQIHVDAHGIARLVLYSSQLESDGSFSKVVAARLTMRHSVMQEIGEAMALSHPGSGRVDTDRHLNA